MKKLYNFDHIRMNCHSLSTQVKSLKDAREMASKAAAEAAKKPKGHYPEPYFQQLYPFPAKVSTWGNYIDKIYRKYAAIYGAFAVFIISSILTGLASVVLMGFATVAVVILAMVAGYHWWTYLDEHTALNGIERNFAFLSALTVHKG